MNLTGFKQHQSRNQLVSQVAYQKKDLCRHQMLLKCIALSMVSTYTAAYTLWSNQIIIVSQPECWSHTWMGQEQSRFNYNRRTHINHTRDIPLRWLRKQPLGPTGILLYKALLPRLGSIVYLLNTQKQTKEAAKIGRQINIPQMEEQEKSQKKELNKMEASSLKQWL